MICPQHNQRKVSVDHVEPFHGREGPMGTPVRMPPQQTPEAMRVPPPPCYPPPHHPGYEPQPPGGGGYHRGPSQQQMEFSPIPIRSSSPPPFPHHPHSHSHHSQQLHHAGGSPMSYRRGSMMPMPHSGSGGGGYRHPMDGAPLPYPPPPPPTRRGSFMPGGSPGRCRTPVGGSSPPRDLMVPAGNNSRVGGDHHETGSLSSGPHNETAPQAAPKKERGPSSSSFPNKLHKILSDQQYHEYINWLPHGRAWRILKPKAFEENVIPKFFRSERYASFMRQVNGWGFKRITEGPDLNAYYHEMFLRGLPDVCAKMRRPQKGQPPTSRDLGECPDFYKISMFAPLPDPDALPPPEPPIVRRTSPHATISASGQAPASPHEASSSPVTSRNDTEGGAAAEDVNSRSNDDGDHNDNNDTNDNNGGNRNSPSGEEKEADNDNINENNDNDENKASSSSSIGSLDKGGSPGMEGGDEGNNSLSSPNVSPLRATPRSEDCSSPRMFSRSPSLGDRSLGSFGSWGDPEEAWSSVIASAGAPPQHSGVPPLPPQHNQHQHSPSSFSPLEPGYRMGQVTPPGPSLFNTPPPPRHPHHSSSCYAPAPRHHPSAPHARYPHTMFDRSSSSDRRGSGPPDSGGLSAADLWYLTHQNRILLKEAHILQDNHRPGPGGESP